jgi:hypothetical protein
MNAPPAQPPERRRSSRLWPTVLVVEDDSQPQWLQKPFTRSQLRVALDLLLSNAALAEE